MAKERKGKKLRRCSKLAPYYKLQYGRTDGNRKRRLSKHIRLHPGDQQAIRAYEQKLNFGDAKGLLASPRARARRRLRRAERRRVA